MVAQLGGLHFSSQAPEIIEKYARQIGSSPQGKGEHKQYLKAPTRIGPRVSGVFLGNPKDSVWEDWGSP